MKVKIINKSKNDLPFYATKGVLEWMYILMKN